MIRAVNRINLGNKMKFKPGMTSYGDKQSKEEKDEEKIR